ncbi:Fimbrial protein [Pseudomonas chlororaphis subsp. piscium]|uniref:fimbrial protein n=1 Tax=Pseudomonas chlororaphis TaxID=587753 RepID=UPI00087DDF52|nr:fimbrial protein [Pseudomonas chlororaphis]AZC32230.1 Fimbrial protein [Pseudomonas chlororaphis subsp. piscium]WDG89959.1 fimbrial protein [Pseudomonas chlororaphis]SDS70304.1 Pilin (type 1 fimbria component protein) [Pseudomonas chlororaphis]
MGAPVTLNVSVSCPLSGGESGWYLQTIAGMKMSSSVPDTWTNTVWVFDAPYSVKVTSNWNGTTLLSGNTDYNSFGAAAPQGFQGNYRLTFQLYKQASSAPYVDFSNTVLNLVSHNIAANEKSGVLMALNMAGTFNQQAATCRIDTASIPVNLRSASASQLKGVGTTAGDTPFSIGLTCPENIRLYATLTDGSAPGNTSNQLSLAPGSTASGVQLRILQGNRPLAFGPDSSTAGNTNQWEVGLSSGSVQIPLTAQYIATGEISPGTVKGVATFTMSYQ